MAPAHWGPGPSRRQPSTRRPRRRAWNKTTPTTTRQTRSGATGRPRSAGCRSTRTSHPPAQRSSSVPGPARDLPRTHGPMLPGAAVQTANGALSRVEQTKRFAILPVSWEPRRRSGHPHHKTQAPGHRGQIRPTSSSPRTPEPARRRKPAELTPVGHATPQEPRQNCPPPAAAHTQRANQLASQEPRRTRPYACGQPPGRHDGNAPESAIRDPICLRLNALRDRL